MVVSFKDEKEPKAGFNDDFTITATPTVTSNQEASGEKESRPEDRSVIQKTENWLENNQDWLTAGVFLLFGVDTAFDLVERGVKYV
jgi:hypothetical protein